MDILLTAVAFIIIFSVLVLVHEYGHFFVAKKAGIKVEEFGFGLPPRIWGVKKGETIYSINAIPFGGFVKLLGEDSRDAKTAKNKRSFSAKSSRVRILVVVAGVVMNFLLAFLLLTAGFVWGMKPLILSGDDVLANIDGGVIQIQQGIIVKDVNAGGAAAQAGLKAGDRIIDVGGKEIFSQDQLQAAIDAKEAGKNTVLDVERGASKTLVSVTNAGNGLGFSVYDLVYLPRIVVEEVKKDSAAEKAGIQAGDVILSINGKSIYFPEDYQAAFSSSQKLDISLMRDFKEYEVSLELNRKDLTIITGVMPDTPAEKAGFKSGDVVVGINGMTITSPDEVINYTSQHKTDTLLYEVQRGAATVNLSVKPGTDGLIGVGLSQILSYENSDLSVYPSDVPVSVTDIKGVSYPIWQAPVKALEDSGKLAYLTVGMFGDVIRSIVTKLTVPEGVAGPVGIAVMTHSFVQEGLLSLVRFTALLSLSLAIINIFPLPALDGGRLLFILVEIIVGRKINPKFEAYVNAIGMMLLLLLIFYVTYSDIIKLIG